MRTASIAHLLVLGLLGCGGAQPTPEPEAARPPPVQEYAPRRWLNDRHGPRCEPGPEPAAPIEPTARVPSAGRAPVAGYPVEFAATPPGSAPAVADELAPSLDLLRLRLARYGGFVEQLCTSSEAYGATGRCRFTADEAERWADLLSAHARRFGIEGPFEVRAHPTETALYVQTDRAGPGAIAIRKIPVNGAVCVDGHGWPGVEVPPGALSDAALRARAGEHRLWRVDHRPQPVDCGRDQPCVQEYREHPVDAGPLAAEHIEDIARRWLSVGDGERLRVYLIAELRVPQGTDLCVHATTNRPCRELTRGLHHRQIGHPATEDGS